MRTTLIKVWTIAILALAGCATKPTDSIYPPGAAVTARGYDGPKRPETEVATVFVVDGRPRYEAGFICEVDGVTVRGGGCASVVYLTPGAHRLRLKYLSDTQYGDGGLTIQVEAGKLYQLNFTSFRIRDAGMVSLLPMYPGAKLVYRNVAPSKVDKAQLDVPIPYDAN